MTRADGRIDRIEAARAPRFAAALPVEGAAGPGAAHATVVHPVSSRMW